MSCCDLYYGPDASWGFCIVAREVQRELNVDNVVYLNMSVRVGGLGVIHIRKTLFAFPSSSSPIHCLPETIHWACLEFLPSSFPLFQPSCSLLNAHHCLTVLQPHPISLFTALGFFFSTSLHTHLHTHTSLHDGGSHHCFFNYYIKLSVSADCACSDCCQEYPATFTSISLSLYLPLK